MPTIFTHAIAALGLGALFYQREVPKGVWVLGAVCSVLPDLDVVAFRLGIPYEHILGHRGISHAPAFAAVLAAVLVVLFFRRGVSLPGHRLAPFQRWSSRSNTSAHSASPCSASS